MRTRPTLRTFPSRAGARAGLVTVSRLACAWNPVGSTCGVWAILASVPQSVAPEGEGAAQGRRHDPTARGPCMGPCPVGAACHGSVVCVSSSSASGFAVCVAVPCRMFEARGGPAGRYVTRFGRLSCNRIPYRMARHERRAVRTSYRIPFCFRFAVLLSTFSPLTHAGVLWYTRAWYASSYRP